MKGSHFVFTPKRAGKWIVVAYLFVFGLSGQLLANPPGCPCSPCTCGTCHCGGGGKSGGSSHHDHHHDDHDHAGGVGVGVGVDLGGVGQRHREADPFAAGGPSSDGGGHTSEKHVTSTKKHEGKTPNDPFNDIQLTGQQAKGEKVAEAVPH